MPRAAGCEGWVKCSCIDSAHREVKERGCKGPRDGQCNRNEEEKRTENHVRQNASIFHPLFYVSCLRVLLGGTLLANDEKYRVNIG
jgi:hypothetical protein